MANLYNAFSSMLKPKDMEFVEARNINFKPLCNGILPLHIDLVLKNPNNLSLFLESIGVDIQCWGTSIGTTNQKPEIEIVANEEFIITLVIELKVAELKLKLQNNFLDILTQGSINIPIILSGKATIKKFGFCIDIPIQISKEIDITLEQLLNKIKI